MQTFLPYPDFTESAKCLDRLRLGKQRIECLQLLRAILVPGSGWANHPAAKMWTGYDGALALYGVAICNEWMARGYRDSCRDKIESMFPRSYRLTPTDSVLMPHWLGDDAFHASHRSNLLRKDSVWYGRFGWSELPNLPYVWPVAK